MLVLPCCALAMDVGLCEFISASHWQWQLAEPRSVMKESIFRSVWGSSIYLWGRKQMCTNIVIQCDSCGYLWFVAVAYALVLHRSTFWSTSYRLLVCLVKHLMGLSAQ